MKRELAAIGFEISMGFYSKLGSVAGPVIQATGRLTNWGATLHSESASALGLPTVWSLWGNPGMARCQEMSTLPAGYIPQRKVTLASSSGSLCFIMNFHCV